MLIAGTVTAPDFPIELLIVSVSSGCCPFVAIAIGVGHAPLSVVPDGDVQVKLTVTGPDHQPQRLFGWVDVSLKLITGPVSPDSPVRV